MSCIVLDIEQADKNVFKEEGVYVDAEVQGYSIRPPKNYKPTEKAFCCTTNLLGIVWKSESLDYSELPKILLRD